MRQRTKSLRVLLASLVAFLMVLGLGSMIPSLSGNVGGGVTLANAATPDWGGAQDGFQTVAENVTKGTMAGINGRNVSRLGDTLVLYTDLNATTGTNQWGTVAVCEPDATTGNYKITVKHATNAASGINTVIPVGGFVLSQSGADRSTGGIVTWEQGDEVILHDITKGSIKSTELRNNLGNNGQIKGEIEITHINTNWAWGNANMLFTEAYGTNAPAKNWSAYFVFEPIANSNGLFKVVDIKDPSGAATEVAIPAGGFIIVIHDGRSGVGLQGEPSGHKTTIPVGTVCEISGLTELGLNADLANITVDGEKLDGFNVNKREYIVLLDESETVVPTVVATAADAEATVEVVPPAQLAGTTVITVTSKNGEIIKTFSILFTNVRSDIAVEAKVAGHGTATGGGNFYNGEVATLTATPTKNKYVFKEWQIDGEVVSTSNPYKHSVQANVTVQAVFEALNADSFVVTAENKTKNEFVEITAKNYDRKADTLIWFTDINESTGTNPWGNVVVVGADGKVSAFYASGTAEARNVAIPDGGFVLTGAGAEVGTKGWNLDGWAVGDEIVIHDSSLGYVTGGTARAGQYRDVSLAEGVGLIKAEVRVTAKNLVPEGAGAGANHANQTIVYTREYGANTPALTWSAVWVFEEVEGGYKLTDYAAVSAAGVSKAIPNGGFVLVIHDGTTTNLAEGVGLAKHFAVDDICTVSGAVFPGGAKTATVSGLKVNGKDVAGFAAATKTYSVELPAGTTAVPTITGTAADGGSLVIVPPANLNGKATVFALSANGLYVSDVYEISFTVVNKAGLQETYDSLKSKVEADFTADTWTPFKTALDAAKTVLDNANATQSEVDAANTALITAAAELEDAPPPPPADDKKGCFGATVNVSSILMMLVVLSLFVVLAKKRKEVK